MSNLRKSERTRREILDTAWTLIANQGAEISLAAIAEAVGMTRQSIYVHFGSRGGLLVALVRRADEREQIWGAFNTAMQRPSAEERFKACIDAWLEFLPKILPVARDLIRIRTKDEEAGIAWSDRMLELRSFYVTVMQDLQAEKKLNPQWQPQQAAEFMWTHSSVQVWDLLTGDCGWSAERATKSIKDHLCQMLLASQN